MKPLTTVLLCLALAVPAAAQTATEPTLPNQWAGAGVFFNQYASPQINGTAAYAKKILGSGTYSFNAVNFLSYETQPFRVMTTVETGIAQRVTRFGVFEVFALGTLGPATAGNEDGTKLGVAFTGGGFAFAGLGKGWTIGPVLRFVKPTISDTQWSLGLMLGWGE